MTPRALPKVPVLPRPLAAIILLNITLSLCYVAFFSKVAADGELWRADFTAYYTGWKMIVSGQGQNLYDLQAQTVYQQQLLGGRSFADGILPFVNPPHSALPFLPLALLQRNTAQIVWGVLNIGLLIWVIVVLSRIAHTWTPAERLGLMTAVLAFYPLYTTFLLGAFPLLVLLCTLQAYVALQQGRDRAAAAWLLGATIKFQLILLVGIWLCAARRWQVLGWGILFGGATVGLTSALLGWNIWGDYLRLLGIHSQSYNQMGIIPAEAYSLRGTLALHWGRPYASQINQVAMVGLLGAAAVAAFIGLKPWPSDAPTLAWRFGLVSLLGLMFSLHLNHHDALMLVVPAVLFYVFLRERGLSTLAYARFMLCAPLLVFISDIAIKKQLGVQIPVLLMVVLLGWILWARPQPRLKP